MRAAHFILRFIMIECFHHRKGCFFLLRGEGTPIIKEFLQFRRQFDHFTVREKLGQCDAKAFADIFYLIELTPPFIDSNAGNTGYIIPSVSEHPKEALQLLNLMYQDAEIMNLLQYGIEGIDYELVDGAVQKKDGSTYDVMGWVWPNQSISLTSVGIDKGIWEKNREFDASTSAGPAIGFKFNNLMVMNEITACNNVIAKYETALRWGQLEPTENLKKFNEELYAAGLQTIIDEKQKQLDTFLGK